MLQNIDASGCAWRISKKKKGAWFAKNDGFFYFLKRLRINGYSVSMYTLSVLMCTKCTHYVYGFWSFSLFFFYRRIKKGRGQIILWSLLFFFYLQGVLHCHCNSFKLFSYYSIIASLFGWLIIFHRKIVFLECKCRNLTIKYQIFYLKKVGQSYFKHIWLCVV